MHRSVLAYALLTCARDFSDIAVVQVSQKKKGNTLEPMLTRCQSFYENMLLTSKEHFEERDQYVGKFFLGFI